MLTTLTKKVLGSLTLSVFSLSLFATPTLAQSTSYDTPDLSIVNNAIHFWTQELQNGQKAAFASVEVYNASDKTISIPFKIGFQMRYYREDIFYTMQPWETKTASVMWILDDNLWTGENTLSVMIDQENSIVESNESNNTTKSVVSIKENHYITGNLSHQGNDRFGLLPDLSVMDINIYKKNTDGSAKFCGNASECTVNPGDSIFVDVIIQNTGAPHTQDFDLEYITDPGLTEKQTYYERVTTDIYPGDWTVIRKEFSVSKVNNANGENKYIRINIDWGNYVQEIDEGNNYREKSYWVTLPAGSISLNIPQQISPYSGITLTNYPRSTTMEWASVPYAEKYYVEVDCFHCSEANKWSSEADGKPWLLDTTYNKYYTFTFPGDQAGRWRVKATNSSGQESQWSSWWGFNYVTQAQPITLSKPSLLSPADGSHFTNYPRTTYLDWKDNSAANDYVVQIDYYSDGWIMDQKGVPAYGDIITQESFYKFDFVGDQAGRWRVKARNQLGAQSEWSEWRIFDYATAPTVTTPYPSITPAPTAKPQISPTGIPKAAPRAGYEFDINENNINPFSDTNINNLEGKAAAFLYNKGIAGGYPDGEFKGWRDVNRAEIAKFMLNARYGNMNPNEVAPYAIFVDTPVSEWYSIFIYYAFGYGFINGHPDGFYRPGETVNTVEFLKILTTAFNLPVNLEHGYVDVQPADWFNQYAGIAQKYDLFPGRGSKLNPGKYLNRYEVAVAFYNFLTKYQF